MKRLHIFFSIVFSVPSILPLALYGMTPQEIQSDNALEIKNENMHGDPLLPLVLVHGLEQRGKDMASTKALIEDLLPGIQVFTPDLGISYGFASEEFQARQLAQYINSDSVLKDGCNVVGYSNGGIVARAAIEEGIIPAVFFGTLASPHRGVADVPGAGKESVVVEKIVDGVVDIAEEVEKIIPGSPSSVVELWHNPENEDEYLKDNTFLPIYNNEIPHKNSVKFKHNLSSVPFVCIAGTKDTTVKPWQSTIWGYWDAKRSRIVPIEESPIYTALGLNENLECRTFEGQDHGSIRRCSVALKYLVSHFKHRSEVPEKEGKVYEEVEEPLWRRCLCCK